ncbi:MAG: hypothetical protein BWX55_00830 [Deltaproteobacteria bacterium ADurb.Bin022]|nr:MAG: hypothetical protein BWX55_00830 [Deltaproteobacteria bacterium ADurb.Bin022]
MSAGVTMFCFKQFGRFIETLFISRTEHPRLNARSLIELIDLQQFIHVGADHQGNAAPDGTTTEVYGRTGAVNRYGNVFLMTVLNNFLHILFVTRMHHHVRDFPDNPQTQFQHLFRGFA